MYGNLAFTAMLSLLVLVKTNWRDTTKKRKNKPTNQKKKPNKTPPKPNSLNPLAVNKRGEDSRKGVWSFSFFSCVLVNSVTAFELLVLPYKKGQQKRN